jgi:hypothetical protein
MSSHTHPSMVTAADLNEYLGPPVLAPQIIGGRYGCDSVVPSAL